MSNTVRLHRRLPTRLPRPWDSPGKNTGVGCHFLLQCMKVKSESEVAQSCPTLRNPMDCSLPGSSVHGIFQERVLEWGAIAFSVSCTVGVKYLIVEFPGAPAHRPQHTVSLRLPALAATGRRRRFCLSLCHLSLPTQPTSPRATLD